MTGFRWAKEWTVRRGMLLCGIVVCLSIALSLLLPSIWSLCLLLLLLVSLVLMLLVPRLRFAVPVFCVIVAVLALLRGVSYTVWQVPATEELIGTTDTITGQVIDCPSSGQMYTLHITQAQSLPTGTPLLLYCNDRVAPRLHDTVTASVEYRALYDTQQYRRADGVYLQAYPITFGDEAITVSASQSFSTWTIWLRPVRDYLTTHITEVLRGEEGALLTAICVGDKSGLSSAVSDAFSACGLPHLLAVSGLHLTVVAGSLHTALRRLRLQRYITSAVTLAVIFLYMWMIEFTPSVTRAGIMYGILLIGEFFRRKSDGLNSLGLALTLILLAAPNAIYDLGLWLSFGAAAGILFLFPRLSQWLRTFFAFVPAALQKPVGWISDSVAVTVAATLPLLPVLAFTFRELSLITPLANLLSVMPAGWMLVVGFLGALLRSSVILAWLGNALLFVAGLLAKYLMAVSEWLGSFTGATLSLQQLWQLVWLIGACAALSVVLYRFRARTVRRVWCCLLALLLFAHSVNALLTKDATSVHVLSDKGTAVILLERQGKTAILSQQLSGVDTARRAMENDGYHYPQLLMVGDGELPYAAYLSEWMTSYPSTQIVTAGSSSTIAPDMPSLAIGERVRFWDDHTVRVLDGGWWLLTMEATTLLIAPPGVVLPPEGVAADGYVLSADAITDTLALHGSMVFCIKSEDNATTVTADGALQVITDEESCRVITGGSGDWRKLLL